MYNIVVPLTVSTVLME